MNVIAPEDWDFVVTEDLVEHYDKVMTYAYEENYEYLLQFEKYLDERKFNDVAV